VKVLIPSPLLSYTKAGEVEASGATLSALVADPLGKPDRRYPGLGFRPHMRFFVNGELVKDPKKRLRASDEVQLVQGGARHLEITDRDFKIGAFDF